METLFSVFNLDETGLAALGMKKFTVDFLLTVLDERDQIGLKGLIKIFEGSEDFGSNSIC